MDDAPRHRVARQRFDLRPLLDAHLERTHGGPKRQIDHARAPRLPVHRVFAAMFVPLRVLLVVEVAGIRGELPGPVRLLTVDVEPGHRRRPHEGVHGARIVHHPLEHQPPPLRHEPHVHARCVVTHAPDGIRHPALRALRQTAVGRFAVRERRPLDGQLRAVIPVVVVQLRRLCGGGTEGQHAETRQQSVLHSITPLLDFEIIPYPEPFWGSGRYGKAALRVKAPQDRTPRRPFLIYWSP